jgi:ABC-type Zn2+ transport system substrate-binding protein/surface adhesin
MDSERNHDQGPNMGLWLGIAVGAAIGIGIAMSRRKRSPWDSARKITDRLTSHSGDFADATSNIMQRVKTIYDEGCKVVEEAGELWSHGRKLVHR